MSLSVHVAKDGTIQHEAALSDEVEGKAEKHFLECENKLPLMQVVVTDPLYHRIRRRFERHTEPKIVEHQVVSPRHQEYHGNRQKQDHDVHGCHLMVDFAIPRENCRLEVYNRKSWNEPVVHYQLLVFVHEYVFFHDLVKTVILAALVVAFSFFEPTVPSTGIYHELEQDDSHDDD